MHEELLAVCAYKEEKDLTSEEREVWRNERTICHLHFLHFLKWVRLVIPLLPGEEGSPIKPLELWPHIIEVIRALKTRNFLSILKARQIGLSTIIAAYVVWYALSKVGSLILLFSVGEREAAELLQKCRTIYNQLPGFMKSKLDADSSEKMAFASSGSVIHALPSTTTASIGFTASLLVWDEHAEHELADEHYRHALPVISRPSEGVGARVISIFTASLGGNDNLATSLFTEAEKKRNNFHPLFFPWDVVPGRDDEWYEYTKKNLSDRDTQGMSKEMVMSRLYPASIEEALSVLENVVVFDKKVLNAMSEDARTYLEIVDELDTSICHVYKPYHIGSRYVVGTDVSEGVGQDYSVTVVMDNDGQIVADIMSQHLKPEELAFHSVELLKHYHNPIWWIEANLMGRTVIKKAIELGYRKLGYRGDVTWRNISDADLVKVGFHTNEKSRADLFGGLMPAINDYQMRIYNPEGLKQFYSIIRNVNNKGKIEASSGKHDDYVIATGICVLKKGDIQPMQNMEPIRTLDFKEQKRPDVIEALLRS